MTRNTRKIKIDQLRTLDTAAPLDAIHQAQIPPSLISLARHFASDGTRGQVA
jgi:hypothetical protein